MTKIERRLGRGLSGLMKTPAEISENEEVSLQKSPIDKIKLLDIDKIFPSITQPRKNFDEKKLEELSHSIKEKGIIQPIIVRNKTPDSFQIIAGERRWRAANKAGLTQVPVIVKDVSDKEAMEYAIIENVQRDDLNIIEEAESYRKLIEDFGYTQDMVSKMIGISRSHIANLLRIISLPSEILKMIEEDRLSSGHAKILINQENQLDLAKLSLENNWSVRKLEKFIKDKKNLESNTKTEPPVLKKENNKEIGENLNRNIDEDIVKNSRSEDKDRETIMLEESISEKIDMKVTINMGLNSGELIISFKSLEELDLLVKKLYSIERLID